MELIDTGHPVFVLVQDTTPRHIAEAIRRLASQQVVTCANVSIDSADTFAICVIHAQASRFTMLAPITGTGNVLLRGTFASSDNVVFPASLEEWHKGLSFFVQGKMEWRHFRELLNITYQGINK
jgi:hypothetical protein